MAPQHPFTPFLRYFRSVTIQLKHQEQIREARLYFLQRNLDKSLELLQPLWGQQETLSPVVLAQVHLLQLRVLLTRSRYQGQPVDEKVMLHHFSAVSELVKHIQEPELQAGVKQALGEWYQWQQEYDQAANSYQQALEIAVGTENVQLMVAVTCAMATLAIAQNEFSTALEHLHACQSYLDLEQENATSLLHAEVLEGFCQVYIKQQEYLQLEPPARKLLTIARRIHDPEKEVQALNALAITYAHQKDYKSAMEYFLQVLDKSKQIHYRTVTAYCLVNMGTIYATLFNYEEAKARYEAALQDYNDVLPSATRVVLLNNVGNMFYDMQEPTIAAGYFRQALSLAKDTGYKQMESMVLAHLSRVNLALEEPEQAARYAHLSLELAETLPEVHHLHLVLLTQAELALRHGDYASAAAIASQALSKAQMHQDTAVAIEVYQLLSSIHEQAGDYAAAFRDLQSKIELQQTLGATQRTHQILDLEIKYDIRQKQQAIDQLQRENKYQALLLEQAEQIKRQNVQLLQANDELRQFTYAVSHDLKEPLRMIGSYVQLLHKHLQPQFDEKTQAYYEYVHSGVTRMNRLLDDLLYYSTVDKVASDLQRVSLQECVEMAVINLRMRIEETGAEITSDPLPEVSGIPSLLIQLLQNLMGNAMKFQPENQLPVIHIGANNGEGKVELYVKDNGIGIPADAHERIFELFSRAHRQPIEGTGIGLAICQKIVSRHGGSIRVDSTPGKGSVFYCTLPVFTEV